MFSKFVAAKGSAIDKENALIIYTPRMLPAQSPDNVEYQYSFYRDDDNIDGLGFFGSGLIVNENGRAQQIFTLDLGREGVLNSIFDRLKKSLRNKDDDIRFLKYLAQGLVTVFESRTDNDNEVRYIAITRSDLLASRGINVPAELENSLSEIFLPEGAIILAETVVPAHSSQVNIQ